MTPKQKTYPATPGPRNCSAHERKHARLWKVRLHAGRTAYADSGGGAILRRVLPALFAAVWHPELAAGGEAVSNVPPKSIRDLRPSERQFVDAMRRLGHGRFESVRIQRRSEEHTSELQSPCNLVARLFFFNDTATTEIYTLSLHDALPIYLRPSERQFVDAMRRLGHGRFESVRIQRGELVLEPPPTAVRSVKFGKPTPNRPQHPSNAFDLKQEVAQLFEAVRGVDDGEIRVLEVRGGLPLSMEIAE